MKKSLSILVFSACIFFSAKAQFSRYLVEFRDKRGTPFALSNPSAFLSSASIQRRDRQNIGIDSTDLPVTPSYINSVLSIPGVQFLNLSKWFNQVLIKISDSTILQQINSFSFVKNVSPVAQNVDLPRNDTIKNKRGGILSFHHSTTGGLDYTKKNFCGPDTNYYNYGNSYPQIHIHNGEFLHNLGFHGENITIAILDAGFYDYLSNPVFDSALLNNQVLGTYDYVYLKPSVNQENVHGAYCFSIMAANLPGQMVGSAPKAKFWLFKTEDVTSEYPVEEQNWVAAAEYADSAGADIISTSLGYDYFDDSIFNLNYPQRNGHTALISIAANFAVAKGMIVTASAGNSGTATDDTKYIACPADADSALAVGATDTSGVIAPFSSWGPNSSGEVKPNVVSVGEGTAIAEPDGTIGSGNGTSFSNPNIAGLVACLWQAFPEFTNHDIINAVQESSSQFTKPDDRYGYGIPDFKKAYTILMQQKQLQSYISSLANGWITVYPNPYSSGFTVLFKTLATGNAYLQLTDATGRIIETKSLAVSSGEYFVVSFNDMTLLARGVYFVHYDDGTKKATLSVVKQ
jgi:serine protease AprX